MKLTNNEIYSYAIALNEAFAGGEQKLPVKINFYLQKNKKTLMALGQDIEESRMNIVRSFGEASEDGESYKIPADKINAAQKEVMDLLELEQEVEIYKINIDNLPEDLSLTTAQMEAIMFMVE
jgi:hypothetical protein